MKSETMADDDNLQLLVELSHVANLVFHIIKSASADIEASGGDVSLLEEWSGKVISAIAIADQNEGFAMRTRIRDVLNSAFLLGISVAKSKESIADVEAIEKAIRSKAGMQSGKKRRALAETGWKLHATHLASDIRKQKPSISQSNLAADIQARWMLRDGTVPGVDSLKLHIRRLESSGKLAKRFVGLVN